MGDKRKSKSRIIQQHFRKRVHERLPYAISRDVAQQIVEQVTTGKSKHLESYSINRTIHAVIVNDTLMVVLYDRNRHMPVTIFDRGMEHNLWLQAELWQKETMNGSLVGSVV